MRAAFASGADIVEFDVHRTADGHFAVFHDWTWTAAPTAKAHARRTLADLKALDIGYGYTADGGGPFPSAARASG